MSGASGSSPPGTAGAPTLVARGLSLAYGPHPVVRDLDLALPRGRFTAIVGANASGKSTLLRGLARLLRPQAGVVLLDGKALASLPTREVARRLGILPAQPQVPAGLTVADLVARGRYPHQRWYARQSREDERAVTAALRATGMEELGERPVDELSSGQRQRAWIAMAIAQEAEIMLLDEPISHLDLAHQVQVLDLLHDLHRTQGRTVVAVLHDINLASRYAEHMVAVRDGRIRAEGRPTDVISADLMADVFGLRCLVVPDPVTGTPLCLPMKNGTHGPTK
jgi:iron complex transport system ATP-binding protein